MIFWILTSIAIAAIAIITIYQFKSRWGFDLGDWASSVGITLVAYILLGGAVVGMGVSAQQFNNGRLELQATYNLRALVTKSATEEHAEAAFFLGFGYASSNSAEVSSISYIQVAEDGGSTLEKADIGESVIYEGSAKPYVEDWVSVAHNDGFFVPWDWTYISSVREHRFHIPTGTIIDQYEVTP